MRVLCVIYHSLPLIHLEKNATSFCLKHFPVFLRYFHVYGDFKWFVHAPVCRMWNELCPHLLSYLRSSALHRSFASEIMVIYWWSYLVFTLWRIPGMHRIRRQDVHEFMLWQDITQRVWRFPLETLLAADDLVDITSPTHLMSVK